MAEFITLQGDWAREKSYSCPCGKIVLVSFVPNSVRCGVFPPGYSSHPSHFRPATMSFFIYPRGRSIFLEKKTDQPGFVTLYHACSSLCRSSVFRRYPSRVATLCVCVMCAPPSYVCMIPPEYSLKKNSPPGLSIAPWGLWFQDKKNPPPGGWETPRRTVLSTLGVLLYPFSSFGGAFSPPSCPARCLR